MPEISRYTTKELKTLQYFCDFDDIFLEALAPLLVIKKFRMGELLVGDDKMNSLIYFLLSGDLRQHVKHPITSKRLTLNLHSYPFVAGLASYNAGFPSEFITAATDSIVLSIELSSIIKLSIQYTEASYLLEEMQNNYHLALGQAGREHAALSEQSELHAWILP